MTTDKKAAPAGTGTASKTTFSAFHSTSSAVDNLQTAITLTVIESSQPKFLTKKFSLKPDGTLGKTSIADLSRGRCETFALENFGEFAGLLDGLESNQALAYGVSPEHPKAHIVTKAALSANPTPNTITRSREFFQFAPAPGVMMLDHDGVQDGQDELTPDKLRAKLLNAAPMLCDAPMLWRPSASSGITTADGQQLTRLGGQRIYIAVTDASQIPAAGKALIDLLWAAGLGWIRIGGAGQTLERTIFDSSVWQPERLDFAAIPVLADGLTREAPKAMSFNEHSPLTDLRILIAADDGSVKASAKKQREEALRAATPKRDEARAAWVAERAPELAKQRSITEDQAQVILRRACEKRTLMGDFLLKSSDGVDVTVGDLLDNPERWHGKRFADPLEPTYGNDNRIAWANLRGGGRPHLYSHAHGGMRYNLVRPSQRIQLAAGQRARVTDSLLDLERQRGELYDFGDGASLVRLAGARTVPVTRDWLIDHFDRCAEFFSVKMVNEVPMQIPQDAPMWLAASVLAKNGERKFPRLSAVITAPILRRDGSILAEPGHDHESSLLFVTDSETVPRVPDRPTVQQALAALNRLWAPVRLFPMVDDVDRGVVLAALITACLRPSLPTSPAFGLDAPAAGTGKTLLAQVVGALGSGETPAAMPPASNKDEECRKRLFASLRDGYKSILWDNVRDVFGNSAIDAFLTAPVFADRILGVSETACLPNRALFLVTGNNLRLLGDTCRRVLVARIDATIDTPYARTFDFDPLQTVLGRRESLVIDALTIVRAWITAGRPRLAEGRTASFETWDDLVRQPVVWISQFTHDAGLPAFADPLSATKRAFEHDPETAKLRAILDAWADCFGSHPTTVAEAVSRATNNADDGSTALRDAIDEIASERGTINRRILGRWIERHVDSRRGGRWFVRGNIRRGSPTWVLRTESPATIDRAKPTNSHQTHHDTRQQSPAPSVSVVGLVGYGGFVEANPETSFPVEIEI
ncbi:MAG TPA: hypothetical protein PK752_04420 [Accumulibacter sp.]|uniref:hypothetical protein n=1 Tax=Accumulibacter sp. TaxID=2053492 RepID=UPI002B58AE6E|nr:hypothetical protein [Accumulibacter sp.]HRD87493.1 hypothetical protein [Accumulibacter sp.]